MKKFEVVKDKENIEFVLELEENYKVSIEIQKNTYTWLYSFCVPFDQWFRFGIKDKHFLCGSYAGFPNWVQLDAQNGFYELFRQIKKDPSYRLKVMYMLNDENRKVWNIV